MAQWAPFTVVVGILTVVLLLLSRQSQRVIERAGTADDEREFIENRTDGQQSSEDHATPDVNDLDVGEETEEIDRWLGAGPQQPTNQQPADGSGPNTDTGERSQLPAEFELTPRAMLLNVGITQGFVTVVILAAAWYFSVPAEAFGIRDAATSTGVPAIGAGVGFGAVLWVGNELSTNLADAVGAAYDESVRELLAPASAGGWLVLFGLVLPIIAITEELLFRAALIGVPEAGFGISPWLLAVVASLAFALGHGAQGRVGIVVTGVLGFVLAAGYILSGSLLLVIVAHYVINALEFCLHEYLDIDALGESERITG